MFYNKRNKKQVALYRAIAFVLINAVVVLAVCTVVIAVLNSKVVTVVPTMVAVNTSQAPQDNSVIINTPLSAKHLSYTFDNEYYSYTDNGKLYICSTKDGTTKKVVAETSPITYSLTINGVDLVMYLYIDSSDKVHISTYNIALDKTLTFKPFKASSGSSIALVSYSININYIIVDVTKNGRDTLYSINIINNVAEHPQATEVSSIVQSTNTVALYYQDKNGVLYYNYEKASSMLGQSVQLLGRDDNDNYYLLKSDGSNEVDVLHAGKITSSFTLEAGYKSFYYDTNVIYAVYDGYIINLTNGSMDKTTYNNKFDFSAIINDKIYLLPKN